MNKRMALKTVQRMAVYGLVLGLLASIFAPARSSLALSQAQREAFRSGVLYFNTEDGTGGNACGGGPLHGVRFPKINDIESLKQKIEAYIHDAEPSSPLISHAGDFVSSAQENDVNPVVMVAIGQVESQFGTTGHGPPPQNNPFGIRGSGRGGFRDFPDYKTAISELAQLLAGHLYIGPPSSFTTIEQIMNRYAPPFENDTTHYIEFIDNVLEKLLGNGTVDTTSSGCGGSAGELGWELSGDHGMVSYNQGDPKWGSQPYGAGKASIAESGCGPTSLAMIGSTLLGDSSITPLTVATKYGDQHHIPGDGTNWTLMPVFAHDNGLKMQDLGTDLSAAAEIIRSGGMVLVSVAPGYFTTGGHLMVIRAITPDGTGFYLNDPNGDGKHGDSEKRSFSADFLNSEGSLRHLWGYTK